MGTHTSFDLIVTLGIMRLKEKGVRPLLSTTPQRW
jgi:hypothetical protein